MCAFFHNAKCAIVGEFMKDLIFFEASLSQGVADFAWRTKSEDENGDGGENDESEKGPPT